MNERIRALAEQAGYGRDRWTTTEQFEDFLHSLVHSVVQECCALIAPSQEHRDDASWGYIGGAEGVELLDGSVRLIKEHFGVE